jgi:hypothetical protein
LHTVLQRTQLGALFRSVVDDRGVGELRQFVAHFVVDGFMHVKPLDGQTHLPAVLESAQRLRRARHDLAPGGRRTCEGDFAHVGMMGQGIAEIVGIGDEVDNAVRQKAGDQFSELKAGDRRGRCRLHDQCIPGKQRGGQLEGQDQQPRGQSAKASSVAGLMTGMV